MSNVLGDGGRPLPLFAAPQRKQTVKANMREAREILKRQIKAGKYATKSTTSGTPPKDQPTGQKPSNKTPS
jgi:hypothetical protein